MSNNYCTIELPKGKVFEALERQKGANIDKTREMVLTVYDNGEFKDEFKTFCKNNNFNKTLSIDDESLADMIIKYYNHINWSVEGNVSKRGGDDKIKDNGYVEITDRGLGKRLAANALMSFYNNLVNENDSFKDMSNRVKEHLKTTWNGYIFDYVRGKNKSFGRLQTLVENYNAATDKLAYMDKILGGSKKSTTARNLLAVYKELNGTQSDDYIKEVLWDNRLSPLRKCIEDSFEDGNEKIAAEANRDLNENETEDSDGLKLNDIDLDTTITVLDSHLGNYTTYMMHVGDRIKTRLASLTKLSSYEKHQGIPDTNNNFGIADVMDANKICNLIYTSVSKFNKDEMIKGLRQIAANNKDYLALYQLADELEKDTDFLNEFFTVFAKPVIAKVQTVVVDGTPQTIVSNKRADRKAAMTFDLENNLHNSALVIESGFVKEIAINTGDYIDTAKSYIKDGNIKGAQEFYELALRNVKRYLTLYYPSLKDSAIEAYCELKDYNGKDNKADNLYRKLRKLSTLLGCLNKTIIDAENIVNAIQKNQAKIDEYIAYNNKLREEIKQGIPHSSDDFKDVDSLYSVDVMRGTGGHSYFPLRDAILDYSIVDTQVNSYNVLRNQSSDVINQSHISKLAIMLSNFIEVPNVDADGNFLPGKRYLNPALEKWGAAKLRSKQYKYNNLLLEQTDEEGNVINKGIFRYDYLGNLQLTENAPELAIYLFDGARNADLGDALVYAKMSDGDYFPTTYFAFNSDDSVERKLATYFLRIPSDAPKTFCIQGPRYNVGDLFEDDKEQFNRVKETIRKAINNYEVLEYKEFIERYASKKKEISVAKEHDLPFMLQEGTDVEVSNINSIKVLDGSNVNEANGKKAIAVFKTKEGFVFALSGTLDHKKNYILKDSKFVAMVNGTRPVEGTPVPLKKLPLSIETDLVNRYIRLHNEHPISINGVELEPLKKIVNRNSNVFKMFKNVAKQELLDMAVAIDHYFETDANGWVIKENGEPKLKVAGKQRGYRNYHLDKNGNLIIDKNGRKVLVGGVFKSNKFKITDYNENGDVVEVNYMDALFDDNVSSEDGSDDGKIRLLYGGVTGQTTGQSSTHLGVVKKDGKVDDIVLTAAQEETLDKCIEQFILDYTEQTINRINNYEDFLLGDTSRNAKIDYIINYRLMMYSYDAITEGDIKFYKSAQDILKRAKEYQGSGIPLAVADLTNYDDDFIELENTVFDKDFVDEPVFEVVTETKNGKTRKKKRRALDENGKPKTQKTLIRDLFKGTELEGLKIYNRFNGITIENTTKTNKEAIADLREKLTSKPIKMTKQDADNLLKGYFDTKVNDAQSYITLDEWVRRLIHKGQFKKYLPLIRRLVDRTKPISAEDLKEFVQVQKNFYYDIHYDERYGIEVPRQIKNAEFVLIPKLIEGTELEEVYNTMKSLGIDQLNTVETSKAANEEVLTLWNNDGVITEETLQQFTDNANSCIQTYAYDNLYTQQETPQHANAKNKAGLQLLKKIIDNIPNEGHSLSKLKKDFLKYYSYNIKETSIRLCNNLSIPRDENGNIEVDEDGNLNGDINLEVFYNRLGEELLRKGYDENLLDYVTLDPDTKQPIMPGIINHVIKPFESSIQAVFNRAITRQTLKGFHAAQITNIGMRPLFGKDKRDVRVTLSKELRYHPKNENGEVQDYIEIKVPASFFGINKKDSRFNTIRKKLKKEGKSTLEIENAINEQILKELNEENLDVIMGYRIPTEGKQSVCNMKVVGILDDAYGSTIVVPDDWVAQTGSDFDIDSVYGVQYETYKDATGKLRKIEFKDDSDNISYVDYLNYIGDRSSILYDDNAKGQAVETVKAIKQLDNNTYKQLKEERDKVIETIAEPLRSNIKETEQIAIKRLKKKGFKGKELMSQVHANLASSYKELLQQAIEDEAGDYVINNLKTFVDVETELFNFTNGLSTIDKDSELKNARLSQLVEHNIKDIEQQAIAAGLLSYEDYKKAVDSNPEEVNSRKARSNKIVEIMSKILGDAASLEENLMRSNFDAITEELKVSMNKNLKERRRLRDPYNIMDQVDCQTDATSTLNLKGQSVFLDNMCSVCNTVQPTLTDPITIVYNSDDFKSPNNTPKKVMKRFGIEHKGDVGKTFTIKHTGYGWTGAKGAEQFRSVTNAILTAYSSQTTAHTLDAIKEGSVPNVNTYSFATYKTLLNIGSDYKTAINFIMQPGVKRIIDEVNSNNSVFKKTFGNPIHAAIKKLAKELGVEANVSTPINTVLSSLNQKYGADFNYVLGQGGVPITISLNKTALRDIPIVVNLLIDRLNNKGKFSDNSPVENGDPDLNRKLFDLATILTFAKLHRIASQVGSVAACCNPDKFGAKATVFETKQVFDDILDNIYSDANSNLLVRREREPILAVNGKNMLMSIYPGIENGLKGICESNDADSSYQTLHSFLKYSTALSILTVRKVLDVESKEFSNLVYGIKYKFTGSNKSMDADTYAKVRRYVLTYLYNNVNSIKFANKVQLMKTGYKFVLDSNADSSGTIQQKIEAERMRVYGYNKAPNLVVPIIVDGKTTYKKFEVKDLNNPTKDELNEFATLSPAQKIEFIRTHAADAGIFNVYKVDLYVSPRRGKNLVGRQLIEFSADSFDLNVIRNEFSKAFYSNNPLIAMTARDVVKYAVIVEGLNMTSTAVNKTIPNKVLYENGGSRNLDGLGFVSDIRNMLSGVGKLGSMFNSVETAEHIYENYFRSHPQDNHIKSIFINKTTINKFKLDRLPHDMYHLTPQDDESIDDYHERLTNMGVMYLNDNTGLYEPNSYIKFQFGKKDIRLYKIRQTGNGIVLYPLHALNDNEYGIWSVNSKYRNGVSSAYYEAIIRDLNLANRATRINAQEIYNQINEYRATEGVNGRNLYQGFWADDLKKFSSQLGTREFDINELAKEKHEIELKLDIINKAFGDGEVYKDSGNKGKLYFRSLALLDYIPMDGGYSLQKVKINNTNKYILIKKVNTKYLAKDYLKKDSFGHSKKSTDKIDNVYLRNILESASSNINNLYSVELMPMSDLENNEETDDMGYQSREAELITGAYDMITLEARASGNESSITASEYARSIGYDRSVESVDDKLVDHYRNVAKWANSKAKELKEKFENFQVGTDEPGFNILSDALHERLKNNKPLVEEYMKTVLDARAFVDRMERFYEEKTDGSDLAFDSYLKDIQKAYRDIAALPITEAENKLATTYFTHYSTNPLIINNIINIMDGYYRSDFMWNFEDIAEATNPLVQTILYRVNSNMEAERMQTIKRQREYRNKISDIFSRAKSNGLGVDLRKIFTDNGEFVRDFTPEFKEKVDTLRSNVAKAIENFGRGSIEHLKAKNEFETFKSLYFHQEADPMYYVNKARLEKIILDKAPETYSEYMKLYYQMLDILNYNNNNGLSQDDQKRVNALKDAMYNLYRPEIYYKDGEAKQRDTFEPGIGYSDEYLAELKIYGADKANFLASYIEASKQNDAEYFTYDESFGFRDLLNMYLNIVSEKENRDINGIPRTTYEELENDTRYQEAKEWLLTNARFDIKPTEYAEKNPNSIFNRLTKAFKSFGLGKNNKSKESNRICREANNGKGIYDEHRIPNGMLLTEEERKKIKDAQLIDFYGRQIPEGSDKLLISSAIPSSVVLNSAFWKRVRSNGAISLTWTKKVTELNSILEKYVNENTGTVDLSTIPNTSKGRNELRRIRDLYQELRSIDKYSDSSNGAEISSFIKDTCQSIVNKEAFLAQHMAATDNNNMQISETDEEKEEEVDNKSYFDLWAEVNCELDENGNIVYNKEGKVIPNKLLYNSITLKDKYLNDTNSSVYKAFVDTNREENLKLINTYYRRVPTKYYIQARREAEKRGETDPNYYKEWYAANHIYNPYTRKYQLLDCWIETSINTELFRNNEQEGKWVPTGNQKEKQVRLNKRNESYRKELGLLGNYVKGAHKDSTEFKNYDNPIELNEYEQELRYYLFNLLQTTAKVPSAEKFFRSGKLPIEAKPEKTNAVKVGKGIAGLFGFGLSNSNNKQKYFSEIGWDEDVTPLMPMTELLRSKDSKTYDVPKPNKKDNKYIINGTFDAESYNKDLQDWEQGKKEIDDFNKKVSEDLMNKDWIQVIDNYLAKAGHYNAVLQNKKNLYYLLNMLRRQKTLIQNSNYKGGIKTDAKRNNRNNLSYEQTIDNHLIEQLETFIRRFAFDQWKEDDPKVAKMNNLQGFTSANYMMLNLRGGFANVTVGEVGILTEAIAGEYFNKSDWKFGTWEWIKGTGGFGQSAYNAMFGTDKERAFNKQDAIVKFFLSVDYDELSGVCRQLSLDEYFERLRNFMYSPQSIGEHFMQNSVLFAMLKSHKLIKFDADPYNIGYTFMNEQEYIRYKEGIELIDILDEEQQKEYTKFRNEVLNSPDSKTKYAWFRRNILSEFILTHCTNAQIKEFNRRKKDNKDKYIKEFNASPDLYSQLSFEQDGRMGFEQGSILSTLDVNMPNEGTTKAYNILGRFSDRVRKVNNKIHGSYSRLGKANVEKKWYGSLLMQFHKHIPMGIRKRFRKQGYYNEARGTIEKGFWTSVVDFCSLNFEKATGLNTQEINTLKTIQAFFANIGDFISSISLTWNTIEDYERNNIKRNLGEVAAVLSAILASMALQLGADDDDEEKGYLYSFLLYQSDRLASESFMWNPIGAVSEVKKLMSTPIAAQSIITDISNTCKVITDVIIEGEDWDPTYQTGRFAGENRFKVFTLRRIPGWAGVQSIIDLPKSNSYYKLGDNAITIFPTKKITDWIKD